MFGNALGEHARLAGEGGGGDLDAKEIEDEARDWVDAATDHVPRLVPEIACAR